MPRLFQDLQIQVLGFFAATQTKEDFETYFWTHILFYVDSEHVNESQPKVIGLYLQIFRERCGKNNGLRQACSAIWGHICLLSLFFFTFFSCFSLPPFLTINRNEVLSIPEFFLTLLLTAESLDTFYSFPKGGTSPIFSRIFLFQ